MPGDRFLLFLFLTGCYSIRYGLSILHSILNENKSLKKSLKVKLSVYKLSCHQFHITWYRRMTACVLGCDYRK